MKKEDLYIEYRLKNKNKKPIIFYVVILFLLGGFCYFVSQFIPTSLFRLNYRQISEEHTIYVLSGGEFLSYEQANLKSKKIKSFGGAGYIFENQKYLCIIAIYPTLSDAENVKKQLASKNISCEILEINMRSTIFKKSPKITNYKEIYDVYFNSYYTIHSIFEQYCSKEFDFFVLKAKFNNFYIEAKKKIENFIKTDYNTEEIIYFKTHLVQLLKDLKKIDEVEENELNWQVFYIQCKIIFESGLI